MISLHRVSFLTPALSAALLCANTLAILASGLEPGADTLPPGLHPAYIDQRERVSWDEIVVRFLPEAGARVRDGRLVSLSGSDLSEVESIVAAFAGVVEPRFPQSEMTLDALRARGEAKARRTLPDLNSFATVRLPHQPDAARALTRLDTILGELAASGPVAEAWPAPHTEPAGIASGPPQADHRGNTPDFSPQQGYLYQAPIGVDAPTAWTYPGGYGEGVDMIDIEWGWLFTHEDLKAPFHVDGAAGEDDHGTAVLGEIAGQHNGYGVSGISPEVRIGGISLNTFSVAGAIAEAATILDPGDVFLMEVQCGGPQGWMPCEWWSDVYAAIEVATAAGVICVEAGGNGTVNLDDPLYGGLFDRRIRDSNAILVGAGTPSGLSAEWFSNYGSRADLQGWGSSIVTTCCGDLQNGVPEVRYTAGFNGTSGASPIVVGSLCSLQGQALALFGMPLTPDLAEEILGATGSPWTGDRQIGERPDLAAARGRLILGYGDLTLLVRDGDTLEPLPGRTIVFVETGRLNRTGPDGTAAMQMSATPVTIRVEGDFYYSPAEVPFVMSPGGTEWLTIDLFRTPSGSIAGNVRGTTGTTIPNATLALLDTPLAAVEAGADGSYSIDGIPENDDYAALAYGVPTYGVAHATLAVEGGNVTGWNPVLVGATTFETSGGGYVRTNEWEWGAPGSPPSAFSGAKVWGTRFGGFYGDNLTSTLTSPVFDMSDADQILLSFHHWYWVEEEDGGQVQIYESPPGRWIAVEPIGGYPDDSIPVLGPSGGYNGYTSSGYVPAIFDLSEHAGGSFKFRFYFRSDASGHKLGWYIDDVTLDTGQGSTVSVEDMLTPGEMPQLSLVSTGSNPTAGASSIRFALRSAADVELSIVDAAGERLSRQRRRLGAGTHEMRWDGRSDRGAEAPAGVFFFRLSAGSEEVGGRWIRVR